MQDRDEVEIKLAWMERYVLDLDGVVRGLAEEVVRLREEVQELRARRASGEDAGEEPFDLLYEKPPHY